MEEDSKDTQRSIYRILTPVNKLLTRYPNCIQKDQVLKEEDISWVTDQIGIIWENVKSSRFKNEFKGLNSARNFNSHKLESLSQNDLCQLFNSVYGELKKLKSNLESKLQLDTNSNKRRYVNFGPSSFGGEPERQQFIDAMEDACSSSVSKQEKIELPNNQFTQSMQQIFSEAIVPNAEYISKHLGLSESIQSDILEWTKKIDLKLLSENPFVKENQYIDYLELQSPSDIVNKLESIQKKYSELSNGKINFNFYREEWNATSNIDETLKQRKANAISSALLEKMKSEYLSRKVKWELKIIDEMRSSFIQELLENLKKYMEIEKILSSFCDEPGFLWDLGKGFFKERGFEILNRYEKLLEMDEGLKKLAELIGKQSQLQKEYEMELRSKVVITNEYHPMPAYKGQICGIKTSNDISSSLPSELALFHNPKTKKLFELKFAQNQLLSFKYENNFPSETTNTITEIVGREKINPKGPIIICVDTSGSMHGAPEQIAKTITFALMKTARKEHRKCYLISFSTDIETLSLSGDKSNSSAEMDRLVQFLQMSFYGGTDACPALNHALEMLKNEDYHNADVLLISDFVMQDLNNSLIKEIKREKENNTDFYSLVIGSSQNKNAVSVFNKNWCYDLSEKDSKKILVEIPTIL